METGNRRLGAQGWEHHWDGVAVQSLTPLRLFAAPWTASMSGFPVLHCLLDSPSSQRCCLTISSSAALFNFCPQSFPGSGSLPVSQLFASGGQSIGVSASKSVLPMNTQDWSPLGWTDWISLQSKGLSRVFSNTIVQKHQFFGAQLSLCESNSHIHTWPLEKP